MPSIKKQDELAAEEENRVQKRKDALGEEGLKQKAFELLSAKIECEVNIFKYLIESNIYFDVLFFVVWNYKL